MKMIVETKKQEILYAAAAEFLFRGYAASSLSSVAGRLGLTKGALAHHFPTKNELLIGLGEHLSEAIKTSGKLTQESFPGSGIHAAVAYMINLGAIAARDTRVAAAMQLIADKGTPSTLLSEIIFSWVDGLEMFLQEAQNSGQIETTFTAREAAEFMLTTNLGATIIPNRSEQPRNRVRRLNYIRLAISGLGVEDAKRVIDDVLDSEHIDVSALGLSA